MTGFIPPSSGVGRSSMLRRLLTEAKADRRDRHRSLFPKVLDGVGAPEHALRRRRASLLAERMLCVRMRGEVECARYLNVLAGRQHMASGVISTMATCVARMRMHPFRARALAVALTDFLHFAEAGVPAGGRVGVYLAVAFDEDRLVVGLGIDGDAQPLAPASGTRALTRAREIVRLLSGEFQRGMDNGRMVFGLTFPRAIAEELDG